MSSLAIANAMQHPLISLAVDLGAESGRVHLGRFDGERITLDEAHRFPNRPVLLPDGLHWDVLALFGDLLAGLTAAAARAPSPPRSVAVDAWGGDFGLLDRAGALVGNPYHYRDARTAGILDRLLARVSWREIYQATGIQMMPINALGQLLSMVETPPLAIAERLLLIPDLLAYWLGGVAANERTNASTTQLYDPVRRAWAWRLIERLDLPDRLFRLPLLDPGTTLGPLRSAVATATRLPPGCAVVAVGSHDTASAVAAVPATGDDWAYISSGTWSLVGVEAAAPLLTELAMALNLTNEIGLCDTVRLLKNVMGLWLLQECRRTWAAVGSSHSYEDLMRLAEEATPFGPLVDPDHPSLLPPGDMPARLRALCRQSGQPPPVATGVVVRCVLESLALKYRWVIERIVAVTGRPIATIHIIGGGARNTLLCQLTADATGRRVVAGPVEATAIGNLLGQALAFGEVGTLAEMRAVVHQSIVPVVYEPAGSAAAWDDAYGRLSRLVAATPPAVPE